MLTPDGEGGFRATGGKYYIGNGNVARMVSVFGRRSDVDGPDGYVFFAVDSQHENYRLVKNIVQAQMFVSEFRLEDYPVRAQDVLHTGQAAFDAALNTVNVGKFNIGFASVGMCEHAMYEAVTHAHNRILYGNRVTDFPHVRRSLVDAYVRLIAMKAFGDRAIDYFRSAGPQDRRYLLFNPVAKMKMTTEGEKVIGSLWDVIAAKGFERDTYFRGAGKDVGALAKLEGTVHVNLALILKFMPNYLFAPDRASTAGYPAGPGRRRVPVPPGPCARPGRGHLPRLAKGLRAVRRPAQRRTVPGPGRGLRHLAAHCGAGRRATRGPGLPAGAGTVVHAGRLFPTDTRAGRV